MIKTLVEILITALQKEFPNVYFCYDVVPKEHPHCVIYITNRNFAYFTTDTAVDNIELTLIYADKITEDIGKQQIYDTAVNIGWMLDNRYPVSHKDIRIQSMQVNEIVPLATDAKENIIIYGIQLNILAGHRKKRNFNLLLNNK